MKYDTKDALLSDVAREYQSLLVLVDSIPVPEQLTPGVWGEAWNVRDLIAHLHAWHELFLTWWAAGMRSAKPAMPAPGYKWSETPRLNHDIRRRFADTDPVKARQLFEASFAEVVRIVESLEGRLLMEPGHFAWTGRNPLVTYVGANTASHYRFAKKVLKRWQRTSRTQD